MGAFLNFVGVFHDIRALQEAQTAMEPPGEIRGCL